jgi:hypothetical protein
LRAELRDWLLAVSLAMTSLYAEVESTHVMFPISGFQEKYDFHPDTIFGHFIGFNGYSLLKHPQSGDIS